MKKELENNLYNIDPIFFEDAIACENKEKNEMDTCMYWGCECGDGWFKPLEKFMHKVKFINDLAKQYNLKFICKQLKEKYGELRVYYKAVSINEDINTKDNEVDYLIDMFEDVLKRAEDDCWNVCEWCGAEGGYDGENLITTSGWISRICKKCSKEQIERLTKKYDKDNNKEYIPRITLFKEGYEFLSPFHTDGFSYKDNYYMSIIEAFFCEKDLKNKDIYKKIGAFEKEKRLPYLIKDVANRLGIIYEDTKQDYELLKDIVRSKFTYTYNEDLKKEFLETDGKLLQNMGYHHDNILGHCNCKDCENKKHKDLYAKILMEVRDELKK